MNLKDPIFIVGDFNMDLNFDRSKILKEFMCEYRLKNFIKVPTRLCSRVIIKGSNIKNSSTLIDVLIHNDDLITNALVVDCPFSDHKLIAGSIRIEKEKLVDSIIWAQNLSKKNLTYMNLFYLPKLKENKKIKSIKYGYFRKN